MDEIKAFIKNIDNKNLKEAKSQLIKILADKQNKRKTDIQERI